ncbi:MAG: general secretion pathway protein GspK [Verrucomicrobia bacterium]|nr:general secretion pathway protein GspK [Verrucomicrobiota bacterium]
MKLRVQNSRRGIALIIVMIVIIVLGVLAGGFAYSMRVEMTLARRANFEPDLEWIGRSGVELARFVLAQPIPNEPWDSLDQKWAGGSGIRPGTQAMNTVPTILEEISLENNQVGEGRFSIKIVDAERKMNINLADEPILKQALFLAGVDPSASSSIVEAILDWRDPDDDPRIGGAESAYYLKLDPPYVAKNGPIDDISELLLIRDITPEMFWGGQSGAGNHLLPHSSQPLARGRRRLSRDETDLPPRVGLADLFTAISARQINVNTASAEVLQLVPGVDPLMVQNILRHRGEFPIGPGELAALMPGVGQALFSVRSFTFEVTVDAEIAGVKKQYKAMLRRNSPNSPRDIQVLYLHGA